MAFDGIVIANLVHDLKHRLEGGKINKIAQPENDELLLTIKTAGGGQRRLLISAGASLPLIYLTESNKPSPMDGSGLLHAPAQASSKRQNHRYYSART